MTRVIFLDSGPLGLVTHPKRSAVVIDALAWVSGCVLRGSRVIVPAIVYYEIKRELLRARKSHGVARLDEFINSVPERYLPLTDEALRLAADLWATARQDGQPSAAPGGLDIDVIIAAQALSFADRTEFVVATTNTKHLSQFVEAKLWTEIVA